MDELTDEEIRQLLADPRFTGTTRVQVMSKMSQSEQQRLTHLQGTPNQPTTAATAPLDAAMGAAKGVGEGIVGAGNMMHSIPGLGPLLDKLATMVGPEGTDPKTAFSGANRMMESNNAGESAGKIAERVAEMMVPAGAARTAAVDGLARLIPDAASAGVRVPAYRAATMAGRGVADAGTAGAGALLHGDESPGTEALMGGAGPVAGGLARRALPAVAKSPVARQVLPALAGGATAHAIGHGGLGLGFGMGMYGLGNRALKSAMDNPTTVYEAGKLAEKGAVAGSRVAVSAFDKLKKRRLAHK